MSGANMLTDAGSRMDQRWFPVSALSPGHILHLKFHRLLAVECRLPKGIK